MRRVLIIDDEPAITEGLAALFELEEIRAFTANDETAAEQILADNAIPVVISDLRMSTDDGGFRMLDAVERLSPGSRVAILTAYATPELERELRARGCAAVLRKPMEFDAILAAVAELLAEIELQAAAQELLSGEPADPEQLYHATKKILYSIPVRRYGLSAEDAEDLVQQAWVLYLEKRESVRDGKTWIAGTMLNLCRQRIHRHVRDREMLQPVDTAAGDGALRRERRDDETIAVATAMARLPERDRMLCQFLAIEGRSYDEVCALLDLPPGSVGPLYIRAKKKLRSALSGGRSLNI